MKTKIIIFVTFLLACLVSGQSIDDNEKTKRSGFYKIQDEYHEYAKNREPNYKGSKQFKRWEWFYETRVDSLGIFPAKTYWTELKKIEREKRESQKSFSNWQPLGPVEIPLIINSGNRLGVGRVNCIEFHPTDPNTFWVGAPVGGLWKTSDGGNSWSTSTDELNCIGISDIVANPLQPEIIYIATGDRDGPDIYSIGVMKSTDGGETWQTTGLNYDIPDLTNVCKIHINPADTNELVAATSIGIYKSNNSGVSWDLVSPAYNFKEMIQQHGNPNVLLASTYNRFGGNTKVFRSADGGDSWNELPQFTGFLTNAARTAFATSANNANKIYAVSCTSGNSILQGLYLSEDAGLSWNKISDSNTPDIIGYLYPGMQGNGQGWFDLSIEVSPVNSNEIVVGATHMWRSTDGGDTWVVIQEYYPSPSWVHVDFHEFRYNPINHNLYACCDGGIYGSQDYGTNFTDLSAGLNILQSYRIGASTTIEDFVLMGNQDNGSMRLLDGTFSGILPSDGTECMVDYSSPNIVYASYIPGSFFRSNNYGANWSAITPPGQSGAWLTPMTIHPTKPEILYAGYNALWRSNQRGNAGTWERISDYFPGNLHRIDVAASNDSVIYVCTYQAIWRSNDGGTNWNEISDNLPNGYFTDIEVSPVDEKTLWVCFAHYQGGKKVYRTRNGGKSWENVSLNLPNLHGNCLIYDRNTSDGIYYGNESGVYYINNSMTEWVAMNTNLPNVIVSDLDIQYEFQSIIAGTYGRGLWKSNTFYTNETPEANFNMDDSAECSGKISFTNTTTAYFDSIYWDFGDGNHSTKLNPQHTYTEPGTYEINLTVFQNDIEYQTSQSTDIEMIINIPQVIDGETCGFGPVVLYASGTQQIYWFENDWSGEIVHMGNEYTTPTLFSTTTYYAANGNSENCISLLVPVIATVTPEPDAEFDFDIINAQVSFFNLSGNSSAYLWNFGDGNESSEENPVHQYETMDNYEVELVAYESNCSDTISKSIILLDNKEQLSSKTIRVFPNPAKGRFYIYPAWSDNSKALVQLFNMEGVLMMEKEIIQNGNLITIPSYSSKPGVYLVKYISGSDSYSVKLEIH